MPKFNGVSEVKDNDIYEQLVKQGSFTGSNGVVYTYDQTGRLYVTDDHVEEELRGYITDLQNKVGSLESGSSDISENKLDKNLGAENSGKLLNVDSDGNITTLDNGIAGQVLTSNGESQSPIWSNLDLPEQNVVSLTGTQEDPIVLYDDIEVGKIYFLSGYVKVVQPATAYSLPDSKPTIMCIGLWLNNEKTIEVRGVQFTSTGVYSQGWNFIQTITFHSSSSWGSNSYLSLNSINGTDTIALNVYAPTVSGTSGQILQSNGSDKAPIWIDLPNSGIEILTGTAESPINFATDMEVNHLYSCSGVFFNTVSSSAQSSISGKTVNFQDQGRSFLFYKRNDTSVVCLASSHNTTNSKTTVIIFSAMYGITEITFDSTTGELTNIRSGIGFGRVNGIEGNGNAQALGIYAPIESGTSGQLLQSNGEGAAPTWVTADYVSSAELETKLDINQGTENANKLLNVGSDGNIAFIDNNYITSSVSNLDNYYLKTETYTREEINNQINTIRTGLFKPVDVLPDVGEEGYIYLVSNSSSQGDVSTQAETENVRDEYIWIAADNKYEYIGSTSVDLTNYYNKTETDNLLDDKVNTSSIKIFTLNVTSDDIYNIDSTGKVNIGSGYNDIVYNPITGSSGLDGHIITRKTNVDRIVNALNSLVDRVAALEEQITTLEANSITTEDILTINQGNSQQ